MSRGGRRQATRSSRLTLCLPAQPTSFVGREDDVAELVGMVARLRLVTISGAAGLGKTRLALEVAGQPGVAAPAGVWFASLAALGDGALVAQEIASTLGVGERTGEPLLRTLAEHIADRPLLLVLDNCEHLVDDAARVVEGLLRGCPRLRVLATSRQPLRVTGEVVWRIAPLALPEGVGDDPREVAASEAVRLFLARARRVAPRFRVGRANAAAVALLCRRLDGIPLAIELAAARIETMPLEEVLARLQDRFRLLAASGQATVPRHQTLHTALDWGYRLLDEAERLLFRRLSIFHGGFELEAAEAICAGEGLAKDDVLDLTVALAEKSLLVPRTEGPGPTRYHLLETVREYAAERLEESGEGPRVARAHAAHFVAVAERGERHERGPQHVEWLQRLEADHDNLRAALGWCRANEHDAWLRLAGLLAWFWVTRGHFTEGRQWLEAALAAAGESAAARADGVLALARLSFWQGDYASARSLCDRGLDLYESRDDAVGRGRALTLLGSIYAYEGRYDAGRERFEEVLVTVSDQGIRLEAMVALGELLVQAGRLAEARPALEEVRALARGPEAPRGRAALFLGLVAVFEGDEAAGRPLLAESLGIFQRLRNRYAAAASLDGLAGLALSDGDPLRALRLSGAAAALRDATGAQLAPSWREVVRTMVVEPAAAAAGEGAEAAWAEGQAMALDEAVAAATEGQPVLVRGQRRAAPASGWPDGLSAREVEVAHLVGQGLTNRQIAERLSIAERTAEGHVERLRKKLDVRSRREIAVTLVRRRAWR